eukprot:jgi/Tetstr1/454365/TSEL_041272.t1
MLTAKEADHDISAMSRMLLQGYAMLEQSCATCKVPLMRKRGAEHSMCVHCKGTFNREGLSVIGGEGSPATAAPPALPPAAQPEEQPPQSPAAAAAGGSVGGEVEEYRRLRAVREREAGDGRRDPADEIAAKMLQGWALLGIHCPRCKQPLLRNKERKMYCAGCSMWVLTEAEAAAVRQAPPPSAPGASNAPAAAAGPPSPAPPQPSPDTAAAPSGGGALGAASAAVLGKLGEAAAQLAATPVSDAVQCGQYLSLIRSCGETLSLLQELGAKHRRLG